MKFSNPAWQARPLRTSARVLASLLRRSVPGWKAPSVPYDHGRSRIIADLETALGLELYRYGKDDPDIELTRRLLKPGDIFVDGGANIGLFTLAAAERVGSDGRVISFEPASRTRRLLARNVDLNNFHWVRIRNEALDEKSGIRSFVTLHGNSSGLSSFAPGKAATAGESEIENVSVVSLDAILTAEERARLTLIKLDLEGAEYGALLGAEALLADVGPDVLVEVEPGHLERHGSSASQLVTLFKRHGYEFFRPRRSLRAQLEIVRENEPTRQCEKPNLLVTKNADRAKEAGIIVRM